MALLYLVGLVTAFITYKLIAYFHREHRFRAFATQHSCAEPKDFSGPWYRRHERLQRVLNMKNSGEDFLDDLIGGDFLDVNTNQRRMFEGSRMIFTIEPANVQAILATQFHDFETGIRLVASLIYPRAQLTPAVLSLISWANTKLFVIRRRFQQLRPFIGRSIFTSDGPFWEHSRALFRPAFSRDNINDLDTTNAAVTALISALGPTNGETGWTNNVDMLPLLYNFTLDTATDFLFGESVNSQDAAIRINNPGAMSDSRDKKEDGTGPQAPSTQFGKDIEAIGEGIVTRIRMQSLYWLGDSFRFRRAIRGVQQYTEYFVQRAIDSTSNDKLQGKSDSTLLSRLATQTQDREELRNQTLAILFAGRDTTSALLCWCFVRLAMHPEILAKLRGIILEDFVDGDPITFAKLKSCRYLQHFLNEILRLHPTVPLNSRLATRDTTLPIGGGPDQRSPIAIAKGETVVFSVYSMHRRSDLWGPDPLTFRPSRWEQTRPSWQFIPFSGGPRICLGQQFALTEASFVLVRVLQAFDRVEAVDPVGMAKFQKRMGVTMPPVDVKVRLHRAA